MTDNDTRTISLADKRGIALVSAEDYTRVQNYCWFLHRGYAITRIGNSTLYLHRLIMSAPDDQMVDHINGDRLDNRRENFRLATNAQNQANVPKRPGTTSRYKGVSWHAFSGRWQARISIDGKQKHLGYFQDEAEDGRMYDVFARKQFGLYAHLNFPELHDEQK
jgi:hypothetical protein